MLSFLRQNEFHDSLSRFINGGVWPGRRLDRLTQYRAVVVREAADWLIREYDCLLSSLGQDATASRSKEIEAYTSDNVQVLHLKALLAELGSENLLGAYVHGSIGSYEEVEYSDLDTLLILGNAVFSDREKLSDVANKLSRWRGNLYTQDPLQHHGWFVLTPFDLDCYCEAYFPLALFEHAKSLFPDRGRSLSIRVRDSQSELEDAFARMAQSIELQLTRERYPRDMYALKSFLSRLMLMPALYVQARDGKGVWKADSFGLARGDFDERVWHCIETATEIRAAWRYDVPTAKRWLMARPDRLGSFARKRLSGGIPAHVGKVLDHAFYQSVKDLIREMRIRVASKDASPMPVVA